MTAYRNADALLHVVRAFRDPSVPAPHETIDPARDIHAVEDELILADLGIAEKRLDRLAKDLKKGKNAELERERDVLAICRATLENGKPLRTLNLSPDDLKRLLSCIGRLEPDRQRMLLLAYYGAFSRDQLSAKLDMPVDLLRASLRRSLLEIERCLKS